MSINKNKSKDTRQPDLEGIKSDFITVASHQLRTPISAIRWSLDTLLGGRVGKLTQDQINVVKEAYQNNKFMVKVVNDLLRVARFEEKGLTLVPEFTDVKKIIKRIVKDYKPFSVASNCDIKIKFDIGLPKSYIDPLNLELVLESLIDNAILYSRGKGRVYIDLKKIKDFLLFRITDNGIGIPADNQEKVFSKFFRSKNAMKAQTEGLGLDLYIAKKIIESSGGKILFSSKEGVGTTFNVYLPLSKDQFATINPIGPKEAGIQDGDDVLKKEREFVAITVHELKAPLGSSKWSLEILKSQKLGSLNNDQIDLIDQVYRGNERLLVLVRDLLNLSKLQEGKFEIESKPIQLEAVTKDVINAFAIDAKKKRITLDWANKTKKWPAVMADPNRVAQVATNLISNAVKYTPDKGKVIVNIQKKSGLEMKRIGDQLSTANIIFASNKKGYLVFSAKDTGIGISEVDKNKLFSRFFRSKKVLKSETEGTGLGLYITKSIVNLHEGDIWFTSELGKGSTFYFSLPIA